MNKNVDNNANFGSEILAWDLYQVQHKAHSYGITDEDPNGPASGVLQLN